jgi:hypothetical protein
MLDYASKSTVGVVGIYRSHLGGEETHKIVHAPSIRNMLLD